MTKEKGKRPKKRIIVGATQQKIMLLLLGGLALGLTRSPKQYFSVVKEIRKEWQAINKQNLERAIRALYASKLLETTAQSIQAMIMMEMLILAQKLRLRSPSALKFRTHHEDRAELSTLSQSRTMVRNQHHTLLKLQE